MKQLLMAAAMSLSLYAGTTSANDFPTQARVEYVIACMNERGEQSYDTLYPCVCIVDRIASSMPYREYVEAETLTFLFSTPGEKGGVFRGRRSVLQETHQGVEGPARGVGSRVSCLPGGEQSVAIDSARSYRPSVAPCCPGSGWRAACT